MVLRTAQPEPSPQVSLGEGERWLYIFLKGGHLKEKTLLALRYLYLYGPCYKSDFTKLLDPQGPRAYDRLSRQMAKERRDDGFIEREIPVQGEKRQARQTATVVALSPAGEAFYKDHEESRFENLKPQVASFLKTTIQLKKYLYPHLVDQKVTMLYKKADVSCFAYEKPSLGYLVYNLSGNKLRFPKQPYDRNYLDRYFESLGPDQKTAELKEFMESGAYYSKQEVISFLKIKDKNYTDDIKGLDWRGVFLSRYSLFVNYVLSFGENKRAYDFNETLGNLLQKLKNSLTIITDVTKTVYNVADSNGGKYVNDIAAVTIGIGSSHTYAEAMGNKHGRIKHRDMSLMESDERVYDVIDCTSSRFDRIYSIDDRELGVSMLNFITHYSLNSYHDLEVELFSEDERFRLVDGSNLFPAVYDPLGVSAIYLPVYDIKILKMIADRAKKENYSVVIAARREMMETISHCVHIESVNDSVEQKRVAGLWFVEVNETDDAITLGDFLDENSGVFNIYDERGYIKGRKMIDDYFLEKKQKLKSEGEYIKLAKLCDTPAKKSMSDFEIRCRFYNRIARKSAERFIKPHLNDIGYEPSCAVQVADIKTTNRKKLAPVSKTVSVTVSVATRNHLRSLASKKNANVTNLTRKMIATCLARAERIAQEKGISEAEALDIVFGDTGQ